MEWTVGDRIKNFPDMADQYSEKMGVEKMSRLRGGTIITVPLATQTAGSGTVEVEWDSLTGEKLDPEAWQTWEHTAMLDRPR